MSNQEVEFQRQHDVHHVNIEVLDVSFAPLPLFAGTVSESLALSLHVAHAHLSLGRKSFSRLSIVKQNESDRI